MKIQEDFGITNLGQKVEWFNDDYYILKEDNQYFVWEHGEIEDFNASAFETLDKAIQWVNYKDKLKEQ